MLSGPAAHTLQVILRMDPINMVEMMGVGVDPEKNGDPVAAEISVWCVGKGRKGLLYLFHLVEFGLQHPQPQVPTSLLISQHPAASVQGL